MADSKHLGDGSVLPKTAKLTWLFLACLALFSIVNVFTCPLFSGGIPLAIFVYTCFGAIGAEAYLHSVWCVLAPARWELRLVTGITTAVILLCAWAAGFIVAQREYGWWGWLSGVTAAFCWLPLLLLAVQVPLWAAKYWFRWQITNRTDSPQKPMSQSLGIRDLMIGTGAIALCLAMGKYGSDQVDDGAFVGLVIAALVVMLISALTTLPATVAVLRSRRLLVALPVILAANTGVLAAFVVIVSIVEQNWPPQEMLPSFVALVISFTVCLTVPLLIARSLGYRLRWGRE